ncbi:MAG TPA: KEOPS complex subunit Pcc1 [Methanocella sp.]|uniref:KEOPS complex subunit Pcc1 n=1 Tax=Methanocella sp. TaxID=2052833 RepID=UPI002C70911B|nr:KEOPS complex subunit Pcc1 [Methanocella sp.]HTY91568.1 KEOPS complex subunit Pcc1 [Methanocella sp.]
MHTVFVEFEFGPMAGKALEVLTPELQASPSERSRITLGVEGGLLKLFIEAEDIISLRAALNTWLRLIKIAEEMFDARKAA